MVTLFQILPHSEVIHRHYHSTIHGSVIISELSLLP
jgi:hypothetical protein